MSRETNGDKIRQMSDKELAKFIAKNKWCNGLGKGCPNITCTECWLEWLESEVEK